MTKGGGRTNIERRTSNIEGTATAEDEEEDEDENDCVQSAIRNQLPPDSYLLPFPFVTFV